MVLVVDIVLIEMYTTDFFGTQSLIEWEYSGHYRELWHY